MYIYIYIYIYINEDIEIIISADKSNYCRLRISPRSKE